jgi:hypothetical protein
VKADKIAKIFKAIVYLPHPPQVDFLHGSRVAFVRPNKVVEYRRRAEEARTEAEAMPDGEARDWLLKTAEVWEGMAEWEEKNPL